jgi:hypothetical protein
MALKNHNNWNNGYSVFGTLPYSVQGAIGSTETLRGSNIGEDTENDECTNTINPYTCHGYKVSLNDVGNNKNQKATTNDRIQNVPYNVEFSIEGGANPILVATVDWATKSTEVNALIPYNFENHVSIESDEGSTWLYAGEESNNIQSLMTINPKANAETMKDGDDKYATKVKDAVYTYIVYTPIGEGKMQEQRVLGDRNTSDFCANFSSVASNCATLPQSSIANNDSALTVDEMHNGKSVKLSQIPFVTDDVPAGSKRCVAVAVFPADSGRDTNWNDLDYKDDNDVSHWRVSPSKCFTVAKRPSLQVWGGNVFSNGGINTSQSMKRHLAGYADYNANMTTSSPYVFGSWNELGVIANGEITGFASGASLGYLNNGNGITWPNPSDDNGINKPEGAERPGGYYNSSSNSTNVFCALSPLTIANQGCNSNKAGNVSTNTATKGISRDRDAVKNLATALGIAQDPIQISGTINEIDNSETNNYYEANGSLTIGGVNNTFNVPNRTILIHNEEKITISNDIRYEDSGGYTNLLQTPKLIIYSDADITINCNVKRIDAVLMAKTVSTCPSTNYGSEDNSNQLFIYGAVIANKLIANRTYGAATGNNSIVPAEIIDFDPTLYLWSGAHNGTDTPEGQEDNNDKDKSLDADIVYTRELAPRY